MENLDKFSEMEQKIQTLEALTKEQSAQIAKMEILIRYYEEQFLLAKRRQFGASSEQSPDQLRLETFFNEAEDQSEPLLPEPSYEEVTYK